jgi:hypothetical protein
MLHRRGKHIQRTVVHFDVVASLLIREKNQTFVDHEISSPFLALKLATRGYKLLLIFAFPGGHLTTARILTLFLSSQVVEVNLACESAVPALPVDLVSMDWATQYLLTSRNFPDSEKERI